MCVTGALGGTSIAKRFGRRCRGMHETISEMNKMIPRLIGEHIDFTFMAGNDLSTFSRTQSKSNSSF